MLVRQTVLGTVVNLEGAMEYLKGVMGCLKGNATGWCHEIITVGLRQCCNTPV